MEKLSLLIDALIQNAEILGVTKQQERAKTKEKKYQKIVDGLKAEILKSVESR